VLQSCRRTCSSDDSDFPDADGDGVPDSVETAQGTDPNDGSSFLDPDGDGVPNYVEDRQGTDSNDGTDAVDTDGLSDYDEVLRGTNPANPDSDGDDIPDNVEVADGSLPTDSQSFADRDLDGVPDLIEINEGSDPDDSTSFVDTDLDGVSNYAAAHGTTTQPVHCSFNFLSNYGSSQSSEDIARLYVTFMRREPEVAGYGYWTGLAEHGLTTADFGRYFAVSDEFAGRQAAMSDGDFITMIYRDFLCRTPSSAGVDYWSSALAGSGATRSDVAEAVLASEEYRSLIGSRGLAPPPTRRISPLTQLAASEARWRQAALMSWGVPRRPRGMFHSSNT